MCNHYLSLSPWSWFWAPGFCGASMGEEGVPHLRLKLPCIHVHHDVPWLVMDAGGGLAHLTPAACTLHAPSAKGSHPLLAPIPQPMLLCWQSQVLHGDASSTFCLVPHGAAWTLFPGAEGGEDSLGSQGSRRGGRQSALGSQIPKQQVLGPPPRGINHELTNRKWQNWKLYQVIYNTGFKYSGMTTFLIT